MTIRPARLSDFTHLETFVWQAVFPAFDVAGLTEHQRAENDAMVEGAREEVMAALGQDFFAVYVALDTKTRSLAGYIIADARPKAYAEIMRLIVKRTFHGKGVGDLLLDEAINFIGKDRAVALAVRHYNQRAIAFFAKHGFVDTGETTGSHAIPRTLMLREADLHTAEKQQAKVASTPTTFGADFPSAADEPVFEPLPDYSLATDDLPLFETGANALRTEDLSEAVTEDTSLTEDQLSVLEAFIAKARAKKGGARPTKPVTTSPNQPTPSAFDRSKIAFEVDFGQVKSSEKNKPVATDAHQPATADSAEPKGDPAAKRPNTSFTFDFTPVAKAEPADVGARRQRAGIVDAEAIGSREEGVAKSPSSVVTPTLKKELGKTKACPDCSTHLPVKARFCYVCGLPQPAPQPTRGTTTEPPQELLELPQLPEETKSEDGEELGKEELPKRPSHDSAKGQPLVTTGTLRKAFRSFLEGRIEAYFGGKIAPKYRARLESNTAFQQVRDGSLSSLASWLNKQPAEDIATARKENVFADLTEYFIVETAGDLCGNVLPQRLLRYQSVNWQTADLFRLVMDYLDFSAETETVHTDFVRMPARALKNATKSFLQAAKDERVFVICDQSLISQAKNGFAITDSGIYWKNVFQPAGAATFTTMQAPKLTQGHLVIDGQFFDAGGRLNLKIAVLLDKLRRMG